VVQLAHREALSLGHDVIGTEHLLMGLLAEGEGVAFQVLKRAAITLEDVRLRVEGAVGRGQPKIKPVDLPLSPRGKRVLEMAMREARNLGVNYVGTEHILLGLLGEGEGMAAQILATMGIDLHRLSQEVTKALSSGSPWGRPRAPRSPGARPRARRPPPWIRSASTSPIWLAGGSWIPSSAGPGRSRG